MSPVTVSQLSMWKETHSTDNARPSGDASCEGGNTAHCSHIFFPNGFHSITQCIVSLPWMGCAAHAVLIQIYKCSKVTMSWVYSYYTVGVGGQWCADMSSSLPHITSKEHSWQASPYPTHDWWYTPSLNHNNNQVYYGMDGWTEINIRTQIC